MWEAFAVSTGAVALGEIGDKTQLLALLLAARWKRPWAICAGITVATLANHALAGALGAWLATLLAPEVLRWLLGGSFLAVAAWLLVPDKADGLPPAQPLGVLGVFGLTAAAFFMAEMGDKTQLATVVLAARFEGQWLAVISGSTLGLLLANVPVVWLGDKLLRRVPVAWVHRTAALMFALLGLGLLLAG